MIDKKLVPFFVIPIVLVTLVVVFIFIYSIFYLLNPERECDHYTDRYYMWCIESVHKKGCYLKCNNKKQKVSRHELIEYALKNNVSVNTLNEVLEKANVNQLSEKEKQNIENSIPYNSNVTIENIKYLKSIFLQLVTSKEYRNSFFKYLEDKDNIIESIFGIKHITQRNDIEKVYLYSEITKKWNEIEKIKNIRYYERLIATTTPKGSAGYAEIIDLENEKNSNYFGIFRTFLIDNNLYLQNNRYEIFRINVDNKKNLNIKRLTDKEIINLLPNTIIIRLSDFKDYKYTISLKNYSNQYLLIDDTTSYNYKYQIKENNNIIIDNIILNLFKPLRTGVIEYGPFGDCSNQTFNLNSCYYIFVQ